MPWDIAENGCPCVQAIARKSAGYEGARVHSGFMHALQASGLYRRLHRHLQRSVRKHKSKRAFFLGHSLGAAMAALAAPMMKESLCIDDVRLWTFGCPRVGNAVRSLSVRVAIVVAMYSLAAMRPAW